MKPRPSSWRAKPSSSPVRPARTAPRRRFPSRGVFTSKRASAPLPDSKALPVRASSCASFATGARRRYLPSDFTPEGLREAVARTVAHADVVAPDECAGLPDEAGSDDAHLDLADPAVAERAGEPKIEDALALERLIREADSRVTNSSGSHYTDSVGVTAIANSSGLAAGYGWTRAGTTTGPVALDGGVKRIAHYGTAARHLRDLESVETVATIAVRRAVDLFGARKPPTMRVPVIFERDVAASILDDLFAAISGANVATGNSWLTGRLGNRIGSDLVTVIDDGRLPARSRQLAVRR